MNRGHYQKILVVNVNWVGDVIFSSPIFKALKTAYPDATVACLAPPRVKEILEGVPALDEIIVYDERGRHFSPLAKGKLILELRRKKFDVAFILHRSLTRALFTYLAGIPVRVGYDTKGRGFLLTHRVPLLPPDSSHRMDQYLRIIESFGVAVNERTYEFSVSKDASVAVEKLLRDNGITEKDRLIVLNPGGNWDLKRWPKENFSGLIEHLMAAHSAKIVLAGALKDLPLVNEIIRNLKEKPVVLTGRTNLTELAALLKRAALVISGDSGPLHLAASVGTPILGLFGPTRPEVTGPRGKNQSVVLQNDVGCNRAPCYNLGCPSNVCMQSITVEEVLNAIKRFKT